MIKVNEIKKVYKNGDQDLHILKGISLHIEKGDFVAIIGPSGSGKSTFMNILGCLDKPSSGEYILDGIPVQNMKEDELSEVRNLKIGFVFQSFNLIPRTTALKNVELPLLYAKYNTKDRRDRALKLLNDVGLGDRYNHVPNELSGGQKQRVAIARALANNPPIIFADEPTGNLDSKSTDEIMEIFKGLNEKGVTIVLVTHEMEIANECKRILTLKDGMLIKDEKTISNLQE